MHLGIRLESSWAILQFDALPFVENRIAWRALASGTAHLYAVRVGDSTRGRAYNPAGGPDLTGRTTR